MEQMQEYKIHKVLKKYKSSGGYKYLVPEHPFRDSRNMVCAHRYNMEAFLGRYLLRNELVMCRDGDKRNLLMNNWFILDYGHTRQYDHIEKRRNKDGSLSKKENVIAPVCQCGCGEELPFENKDCYFIDGHPKKRITPYMRSFLCLETGFSQSTINSYIKNRDLHPSTKKSIKDAIIHYYGSEYYIKNFLNGSN